MGAMYKLKAYFGMVPAEELGEYEDDRYVPAHRSARDRWDESGDAWDDRGRYGRESAPRTVAEQYEADRRAGDRHGADRYDGYGGDRDEDRYASDRPSRSAALDRGALDRADRGLPSPVRSVSAPPPVRGALAIDTASVAPVPSSVPEQRERAATGAAALARITTLQPSSYNEARTIGERYREGIPVIMNLSELDDASAKRLVDFAAGLVFALRGGFDKVTNRVFLLTPADVEVSAEDARKLVGRVGQ